MTDFCAATKVPAEVPTIPICARFVQARNRGLSYRANALPKHHPTGSRDIGGNPSAARIASRLSSAPSWTHPIRHSATAPLRPQEMQRTRRKMAFASQGNPTITKSLCPHWQSMWMTFGIENIYGTCSDSGTKNGPHRQAGAAIDCLLFLSRWK